MSFLEPEQGLVIRYSYLWKREHDQGVEEGRKDRPCAVVLVVSDENETRPRALVLPITHTEPEDLESAVEIPQPVKRRLGLDHDRSWVMISEFNAFYWPGPDLRPVSTNPPKSVYGYLPPRFMAHVRDQFVKLSRERKVSSVPRSE